VGALCCRSVRGSFLQVEEYVHDVLGRLAVAPVLFLNDPVRTIHQRGVSLEIALGRIDVGYRVLFIEL
jgi:hypothetical protein